MADDFQIATPAGTSTVRSYQLGGAQQAQVIFAGPARKTSIGPPEKLSVGTGAVVTLSPPVGATIAWVINDDAIATPQSVRWYDDGTAPTAGTAGNGPPLAPGDYLELNLASFTNFKMIAVTGTATVHVLYWKFV